MSYSVDRRYRTGCIGLPLRYLVGIALLVPSGEMITFAPGFSLTRSHSAYPVAADLASENRLSITSGSDKAGEHLTAGWNVSLLSASLSWKGDRKGRTLWWVFARMKDVLGGRSGIATQNQSKFSEESQHLSNTHKQALF